MRISKPGIRIASAGASGCALSRARRREFSQVPLLLRSVTKMLSPSLWNRRCSREIPVPSSGTGLSGPRPSVTALSRLHRALLRAPLSSGSTEISSSTSLHDLLEIVHQFSAHDRVLPQELENVVLLCIRNGHAELAAGIVHQVAETPRQHLFGLGGIP